jgi:hypothetical protein
MKGLSTKTAGPSFCAARTSTREKLTALSRKETTPFGRGAQCYAKALSRFSLISRVLPAHQSHGIWPWFFTRVSAQFSQSKKDS